MVATGHHSDDVPLEKHLGELVELAWHAPLLGNDVGDAGNFDGAATDHRHLAETPVDDEIVRPGADSGGGRAAQTDASFGFRFRLPPRGAA